MDALLRINKHFGITVICNLHSLDLARSYCDRLIGMAAGRVVFDGAPATLTDQIARELYDLEADEVMGAAPGAGARRCGDSGTRHRRRGLSIASVTVQPVAYLQSANDFCITTERARHDQPSYRSRRRRRAGLHRFRRFGAGLEEQISGTDLRGGAGRERLRRDRALDARSSPICPRNSASRSRCASPTTTPPLSKASAPATSISRATARPRLRARG